MRAPIRRIFALVSATRALSAWARVAALAFLALLAPGCIQLHLSDDAGDFYERGRDIFSTPATRPRRETGVRPPAAVAAASGEAIVVDKPGRRLLVYDRGRLRRRYEIALGRHPEGHKVREGDRRTPEGVYRVLAKKDRGQTRYHRALLLDYPNPSDRALFVRAKAEGKIPKSARIGGLIEIHGGGAIFDWTDGCIALEDRDMDDLFRRVRVGTPIVILGDHEERSGSL